MSVLPVLFNRAGCTVPPALERWIEQRILPLVQAMNHTGWKTQFSCGGHFFRREAWVIFQADAELAYGFAEELKGRDLGLRWFVQPWIGEADAFRLASVPERGSWSAFKKKLSRDSEKIGDLFWVQRNVNQGNHQSKPADDQVGAASQQSVSWAPGLATGATLGVGRDFRSATIATDESRHLINIYRKLTTKSTGIAVLPLERLDEARRLAATLRRLYFEGALAVWPEVDAYFLPGRGVLVRGVGAGSDRKAHEGFLG